VRYSQSARNSMKNVKQRIVASLSSQPFGCDNYLIWAPPGSGKSFFIQEIAKSLGKSIDYRELNLAQLDERELRSALAEIRKFDKPRLCFIDEVDSKPSEPWPYESLLPSLEPPAGEKSIRTCFVLAGSSGNSLVGMKENIGKRPKGTDLLSRIPTGNEFVIEGLGLGDRLLVVSTQFLNAAKDAGRNIDEVEKMVLYYVASSPSLKSARQIRQLAVRCIERMPAGEDRIKFDYLFEAGDPENKEFWVRTGELRNELVNCFVTLESAEGPLTVAIPKPDISSSDVKNEKQEPQATKLSAVSKGGKRIDEQQIRFCASKDGTAIAFAKTGQGPPLVRPATWLGHLQFDFTGIWKHWFIELSKYNSLVRFDQRGCGLSDRRAAEFSFEKCVDDLESVIDSLELERFDLLGMSHGGSVSIAYAVRHPERVNHLILYGAFARGWAKAALRPQKLEEFEALEKLIGSGWGQDNPAFRQIFASLFMPDATAEQARAFNELQKVSVSPETAMKLYRVIGETDVHDLLPKVSVPTIVFHATQDSIAPFRNGLLLASSIPGARFVPLESRNHILQAEEPAWNEFLMEYRHFLGVGGDRLI
jgi:pimeloyl-ACP methyl ester carboxylesterase